MTRIMRSVFCLVVLGPSSARVMAQTSGSHRYSGSVNVGGLGAVSNSFGYGLGGYYGANSFYQPNQFRNANPYQALMPNPFGPMVPRGQEGPGGLKLPSPLYDARGLPATPPPRPNNPGRADELVEVGDRSFRGGNIHRAEEKYKLAAKVNRETPTPHIHLAQVAIIRNDYAGGARHLRDAVASTKGLGWLIKAPDIQALYGEPGDFAKQLGRLESYLQAHPDDRDAWFVLGAEHYFSGHHQTASDVFLRLTDRTPDEALAAFIDASALAVNRSKSEPLDPTN